MKLQALATAFCACCLLVGSVYAQSTGDAADEDKGTATPRDTPHQSDPYPAAAGVDGPAPNTLEKVTVTASRLPALTPMSDVSIGSLVGPLDPAATRQKRAAADNNTKPDCNNKASQHPVILATGEKIQVETDVPAGGTYGLGLSRTYRSMRTAGNLFGTRWSSDYEYRLLPSGCYRDPSFPGKCMPTQVTALFPNGSQYTYLLSPDFYYTYFMPSVENSMGRIIYDPNVSFQLQLPTRTLNFSSSGYIQQVYSVGNVLLLNFNYSTDTKRPDSVTNAAGQQSNSTTTRPRIL